MILFLDSSESYDYETLENIGKGKYSSDNKIPPSRDVNALKRSNIKFNTPMNDSKKFTYGAAYAF